MKKFICAMLLMSLVLSLAICALAAGDTVAFTASSSFQKGGTATVDLVQTAQNVMSSGSVTSEMYNAALEKNMNVMWKCSNGPDKYGTSVTWTEEDVGREYVCRVAFYSDKACTEFIDYIQSNAFIISGAQPPVIYTNEMPDAQLGETYYFKVTCSDPDATFSEFMGSQLSEFGLTLHENGEITGVPNKTGNCHVNIVATGKGGEDMVSFDINVYEEYQPYMELLKEPDKMEYVVGEKFDPKGMQVRIYTFDGSSFLSENGQYLEYYKEPLKNTGDVKIALSNGDLSLVLLIVVKPAPTEAPAETTEATTEATTKATTETTTDPTEPGTEATTENTGDATEAVTEPGETTDSTKPSKSPAQKGEKDQAENQDNDTDGGDIWIFVAIGLGVLVVGMAVAIVVILKKKKA